MVNKVLEGLRGQNEKAQYNGKEGYWVQADCVFIEADSPGHAIEKYRKKLSEAEIACSHNCFCDGIRMKVVCDKIETGKEKCRLAECDLLMQKEEEIEKLKELLERPPNTQSWVTKHDC